MELVGKIKEFTPIETGSSDKGPWRRRQVIIQTLDQNPVTVAFTAMGIHVDELEPRTIGEIVRCRFGVSSRKVNDRWFSDIQLWQCSLV